MNNKLDELRFYQKAKELWELCWNDTEILSKDFRGKEIARQLIRSIGSISANIEEGYGRGLGKEYPHFLRIARGSAQESKGWYQKSRLILNSETINQRSELLGDIIAMINKTIITLEDKKK
jgi:four helix bundle protein